MTTFCFVFRFIVYQTEAYSKPSQIFKMELFAKSSNVDVWLSSEYVATKILLWTRAVRNLVESNSSTSVNSRFYILLHPLIYKCSHAY